MPDEVDNGGGKPGGDQERHVETIIRPADDEEIRNPDSLAFTGGERPAASLNALNPSSISLGNNAVKDPVIGSTVNGYVVRGKLGAGGMGIVYAGDHPVIGKRAAIKVLRPEIAENEEQVKRLVSEARAVNAVGHRGIIDVFGYDTLPDGRQCIVMEYLDGEPLADMLLRNRKEKRVMPIPQVMVVLEEMLSALGAAHSAGVIHRDLKPSNIFLCKQRDGMSYVKLLDFGIAKLGVLGATPQTRASMLVGTPSYMAPEQARGGPVSPAMDLYAVGIIAFEMLTGELPFTGESVVEVLMKHAEEPPPKPSTLLMSIPDDLDELVTKLLAKEPGDRYQSADEVREFVTRVRKSLSESTARSIGLSIGRSIPQSGTHTAVSSSGIPAERVAATPQSAATPRAPVNQETRLSPAEPKAPTTTSEIAKSDPKKLPPEMVAQTLAVPPTQRPTAPGEPAQRSSRGLVLGVIGLLLGLVALAIAYANRPQPIVVPQPVAVPREPVKTVEPTPPPPEPPKPAPEPEKVAEPAPPPPAPEPVKVEPQPAPPPEPAPAPAPKKDPAPVVKKDPAPQPPKPVTPAPSGKSKGDRLLARLMSLQKQSDAKPGALPELDKTRLAKYISKLKEGTVKPEQYDQIEIAAAEMESALKGK